MNINYCNQPVEKAPQSIFLAGPTPADDTTPSWRPDAVKFLREHGFDGVVYVPEYSSDDPEFDYDLQIAWEWRALERASAIMFWIPRDKNTMPGFTTNVEFGYYVRDPKVVYGRPVDSYNNAYLDRMFARHHERAIIYDNLEACCIAAIDASAEDAKPWEKPSSADYRELLG